MTVYSSSTSLILTDLLTREQNYSFAVAVTDSTGQHGPWSDQLMGAWDGEYNSIDCTCISFAHIIFYHHYAVPGLVSNISLECCQTGCIVKWNVSHKNILYK